MRAARLLEGPVARGLGALVKQHRRSPQPPAAEGLLRLSRRIRLPWKIRATIGARIFRNGRILHANGTCGVGGVGEGRGRVLGRAEGSRGVLVVLVVLVVLGHGSGGVLGCWGVGVSWLGAWGAARDAGVARDMS
jgi:hypothetical protein